MFSREEFAQRHFLPLVHHMTSLSNLDSILENGALDSFNVMQNKDYSAISNSEVQRRRSTIFSPIGRSLHEYVPLYFSYKTPMAAVNQRINAEWVYLTFRLEEIVRDIPNIVLADGNAASDDSLMKIVTCIDDFSIVDKKSIYSVRYAHDPELARKKQAEMLVPDRLPTKYLLSITMVDLSCMTQVELILRQYPELIVNLQINSGWFFPGSAQLSEGSFFK